MKYFALDNTAINHQEIGNFPQADGINNEAKFNLWEIEEREDLLGGLLVPPEPIMNKKAKFTTLLSVASINHTHYLVIANSFFEFLKNFTMSRYETWPMRVHHKNGMSQDYSLFRLALSSDKNYINFKASKFSTGGISAIYNQNTKRIPIDVGSFDDYRNYKERLSGTGEMILYDELIIDLSNSQEDIFKLSYTREGYYVSERLKNAIEGQQFTGMAFKEMSEVDKRIKVIY